MTLSDQLGATGTAFVILAAILWLVFGATLNDHRKVLRKTRWIATASSVLGVGFIVASIWAG